jgi:hypothetical protein
MRPAVGFGGLRNRVEDAMAHALPLRRILHPARLAAILLLLVWLGPVTFQQTDAWNLLRLAGTPERASAESKSLSAGEAILLEPGAKLRLRMKDGSTVQGIFLGRGLLDSSLYAPRFYRNSQWSPFVLGEIVRVSLRDGREIHAPFAGYAELTLLLQAPDCSVPMRVPFEFIQKLHRADGDRVEPKDLAKAYRKHWLPSADALVLAGPAASVHDTCQAALTIPAEDIESAIMDVHVGANTAGAVGGGILLGVLVAVVLLTVLAASASSSSSSGCQNVNVPSTGGLLGRAGIHPTTKPFDRERGCWVNEPLLAADPTPATMEGAPSAALPPTVTPVAVQ